MYHFSLVIVFVLVKFLTSMPRSRENGVFVISCEDDRSVCRKPMEAGIPVVSAEVLLAGVLRQELSLEEYPFLCKVSVKSGLDWFEFALLVLVIGPERSVTFN